MPNAIIDNILPKFVTKKEALDKTLETLDPAKIDEIMKYNASRLEVSGAVGFISKGLGADKQDIDKATQ